MLYREALGEVLREIRTDKRKNLVDVSKYVSIAHLSEIERGHNEVSSELLETICSGIGVPIYQVISMTAWKMELNEKQISPSQFDKTPIVR